MIHPPTNHSPSHSPNHLFTYPPTHLPIIQHNKQQRAKKKLVININLNDDEKMLRFNIKFLIIIKHFNIISVNGRLKS